MTKSSSRALVVAAFAAVAVLYYYRLGTAPIYLAHDEVMFGVVAHDIAWHARDVDGNFLPAFMHMNGVYWNMPVHVYLTAPPSCARWGRRRRRFAHRVRRRRCWRYSLSMRSAAAWFRGHRGFAALAAGMLALSPAFFIDSRLSTDHHYPVVAIGLWLICLARVFETEDADRRDLWLGLAGVSLGAGLYTYGASVVLMPIYLALTGLLLLKTNVRRVRPYVVLGAAFAVAVLPFAIFLLRHPGYIGDVANMYKVYDAKRFSALQGAHEILGWTSLGARADVYFSYFNPVDAVFLRRRQPGAIVDAAGRDFSSCRSCFCSRRRNHLYILKRDVEWFAWLALIAFFATPLAFARSIVDEHGAVQRVIAARTVWRHSRRIFRDARVERLADVAARWHVAACGVAADLVCALPLGLSRRLSAALCWILRSRTSVERCRPRSTRRVQRRPALMSA